jgi:isocitrate dehydrogenase
VKVYFKDVFAKHGAVFKEIDFRPNNGLTDLYNKLQGHPKQAEIEADIMMGMRVSASLSSQSHILPPSRITGGRWH